MSEVAPIYHMDGSVEMRPSAELTPYEAWQIICEDIESPQSYIDFGFYFMITCALQRRVWYYDSQQLFPNLYIIFVGKPALGKGSVTERMMKLLRHHRTDMRPPFKTAVGEEKAYLFPIGADTATFEQLCEELKASQSSKISYNPDGSRKAYTHCSLIFLLAELSSLFRRHNEQIGKFLLRTYDCTDYDYKTKHGEPALLRRTCLNMLAGTQMDFLQEAYEGGLFAQGLSSRSIFLFETQKRHWKFHTDGDIDKIRVAEEIILDHLLALSTVFGKLAYTKETEDFLSEWYCTVVRAKDATAGPRMEGYYGRLKVHVLKLAAAIHFSHKLDLVITLDEVKTAIALLDSIEPQMSAGLNIVGRNKMSPFTGQILNMLQGMGNKGLPYRVMIDAFSSDLTVAELDTVLQELVIRRLVSAAHSNNDTVYTAIKV